MIGINTAIETIRQQRNAAFDQIANLQGQLAEANEKVTQLTAQIAGSEAANKASTPEVSA